MRNSILIIGAGGHAKVVSEVINAQQKFDIVAYLDENPKASSFRGKSVFTQLEQYEVLNPQEKIAFVAIGNNGVRKIWTQNLKAKGYKIPVLSHPSAIVSPSAVIDEGTLVMPGVIVNADSHIGTGVILNTGCSVDHDCKIGDFTHLGPQSTLCGGVEIGENVLFGTASVAIPSVKIGNGITIGANSTVTKNIENCTVAVGSPARPIK